MTTTETYGFLFDLDGVLVDTARFHFIAWKRLAEGFEISFDQEQNEQLKGVGRKESLERILSWGGISLSEKAFQEAMSRKNEWYLEMVDELTTEDLLPGVKPFLEGCRRAGIRTALGSASKNAKRILARLEIEGFLDAVVDGTDVQRSKPDPEVFLKGSAAIQVPVEKCVVFEDALAGVEAAKAGGMKSVGVVEPGRQLHADMHIANLAETTPEEVIQRLL